MQKYFVKLRGIPLNVIEDPLLGVPIWPRPWQTSVIQASCVLLFTCHSIFPYPVSDNFMGGCHLTKLESCRLPVL
ncbi:hypothetical protein DPEC_G00021880, partial [Dallia pectoralis]